MADDRDDPDDDHDFILLPQDGSLRADEVRRRVEAAGGEITQQYGTRLLFGRIPPTIKTELDGAPDCFGPAVDRAQVASPRVIQGSPPPPMPLTARLALKAWEDRSHPRYREGKRERRLRDCPWTVADRIETGNFDGDGHPSPSPPPRATDLSPYLVGSAAVTLYFIDGPAPALQFDEAEKQFIFTEVQEGLTFLQNEGRRRGVPIRWDIDQKAVAVAVEPDPGLPAADWRGRENRWCHPALQALGFTPDDRGLDDLAHSTRRLRKTQWAFVAFFTKYPTWQFAYAGKPRVVVRFDETLGGWGRENLHSVFAHETAHIFGCPDEYDEVGCHCEGRHGIFEHPNRNCHGCAGDDFRPCLMERNTDRICDHTAIHLGWWHPHEGRPVRPADDLRGWGESLAVTVDGPPSTAPRPVTAAPTAGLVRLEDIRRFVDEDTMKRISEGLAQDAAGGPDG